MMSKTATKLSVILILICLSSFVSAQTSRRTISVVFEEPHKHFADFTLVDRLNNHLLINEGLDVIIPEDDSLLPAKPNHRFNLDRLIEWGQEVGSRYVIYLQIEDRKIVRRKRTSIPFVLNRYIVEGQIDGVYSLIDLGRSKVVETWKLKTRLSGPRQWQVAEDYPDDPDLHMSAPRKIVFLKELEEKAVTEIVSNIQYHLKGR